MFRRSVALVLPALAWVLLAPAAPAQAAGNTFAIDPVHSFVVFRIRHVELAHVWGRFNAPAGTVAIDDNDPASSSIQIEIKAENIDTGTRMRDNDLRGPDYFDARQFPTITFKSTSIKKTADNTYEVSGDLTLHGVTKPLTVTLTKAGEGDKGPQLGHRAGFETSFTLKRSDFGMTHNLGPIGDEVQMFVSLEARRQ